MTGSALQPPSLRNVESEAAVLAGLMRDNARVDRVADLLTADDFAEPLFGRLFAAMVELSGQGKPANPVVLAPLFEHDVGFQEMQGWRLMADWTASLVAAADPVPMAKHVRELAVRRRLHDQMLSAAASLADLTIATDVSIAEHDTAVSAAFERAELNPFRSGHDVMSEVFASFDRPVIGVSSGGSMSSMDRLIGPIRPGWLVILAARPGMGKTAALVSYLRASAARGHASLFASLEMAWETLSMRMASDACHAAGRPIEFDHLMGGRLSAEERRAISDITGDVEALPFKIIDKRCHTLGQLRRAIRRRKRELQAAGRKLELVVVDYLQLLKPDRPGRSEYEGVSEVSRELKIMAGDEEIGIVALSQLSRAVEQRQDKRPQLSDLRASGQIEQDADVVLFLVSQEYYLRKAEPEPDTAEHIDWQAKLDRAADVLEFICAKHRHGTEGNWFGRFYRRYQAVR